MPSKPPHKLPYCIAVIALMTFAINALADIKFVTESNTEFNVQVLANTEEVGNSAGGQWQENDDAGSQEFVAPLASLRAVTVARGDTLREIANVYRTGDLTSAQIMLALQKANPQAFINGNINQLKEGAILRIPGDLYVNSVEQSQAVTEVARQQNSWREEQVVATNKQGLTNLDGDVVASTELAALNKELALVQEALLQSKLELGSQAASNEALQDTINKLNVSVSVLQEKSAILEQQLAESRRNSSASLDAAAVANGSDNAFNSFGESQKSGSAAKIGWVNLISYAVVAALLVMSPGPNGVLIAKTVPTSGTAAGFANILGFVTALNFHGALSIFGISAILLASPKAFFVVKILGAMYLCWIGFKALIEAYRGIYSEQEVKPASQRRTLRSAFFEGLLTNVLNPKTSMFYIAAFPQFIPTGEGAIASAFMLVSVQTVINIAWFGAMVILLARFTAKVGQSAVFKRWLKTVTGVVFVGFGVKLATFHA